MSTPDATQEPTKKAINEYFKLKSKFEDSLNLLKKKIMNDPSLSKREKRSKYLILEPKCINCKEKSKRGTIFSVVYNPETDSLGAYRKFTAICGNLANPCNLDIEIHLGENEPLDKLMKNIREEIKLYKNKIIDDKNRLLFGLITTETALENFDLNKGYINDLTSVYELYLDLWNKTIENPDDKVKLDESLTISYNKINEIKECIKKMKENDDVQFAVDAANIYANQLKPLLDTIRKLKYSDNIVYHDDYDNKCKLIQRPYTELDMMVNAYPDQVIKYNLGDEVNIKKTKKTFIIDSDEFESSNKNVDDENEEFVFQPKNATQSSSNIQVKNPIKDTPIIGKGSDGIEWNVPEYKSLWQDLPIALKNEFKINIDWMKVFMEQCVNARLNNADCKLPIPNNLIIPPKKINDQYDFGISIYNKAFNEQPKTLQDTYLTYYKEDPTTKQKDYSHLAYMLTRLVETRLAKDSVIYLF
jgi:hypothetical protein